MRFLSILLAAAGTLESARAVPAAAAVSASPSRTIGSGVVVGKATPVTSVSATTTVYNYLGIPFAAPPTGSLRFAPPATPTAWKSPLKATAFPPSCLQQFDLPASEQQFDQTVFNNPGGPPPPESEDCLYLNVFTPTDASSSNLKPVLFWIFGGDLEFGTGSLPFYNGSSFAGFQDVVVVTHNYRTNIFGFSNSPQIPSGQQNSGFLDQRAALEWVQKNIKAFGGDPAKVTIFGESAGGWSVKQLLALPPSPLPYRAAILESQAELFTTNPAVSYQQVSENFGCDKTSSPIDCLRSVSATDIQTYIEDQSLSFTPVADNVTSTMDVRPSILTRKFADVPILMGTNANEGRVFAAEFGFDNTNNTAQLQQYLNQTFPNNPALQHNVLSAYDFLANSTYLFVSQVITDLVFTCTTSSLSNFAVANGYVDLWRYYYNATYPDLATFPDPGAYHSSEIPQVFGTYPLQSPLGPPTADQEGLSRFMQTAWADFAKDPAAGPGWTKLNSGLADVGDLGGVNKTGVTLIPQAAIDENCALFDAIIAAEGY